MAKLSKEQKAQAAQDAYDQRCKNCTLPERKKKKIRITIHPRSPDKIVKLKVLLGPREGHTTGKRFKTLFRGSKNKAGHRLQLGKGDVR